MIVLTVKNPIPKAKPILTLPTKFPTFTTTEQFRKLIQIKVEGEGVLAGWTVRKVGNEFLVFKSSADEKAYYQGEEERADYARKATNSAFKSDLDTSIGNQLSTPDFSKAAQSGILKTLLLIAGIIGAAYLFMKKKK